MATLRDSNVVTITSLDHLARSTANLMAIAERTNAGQIAAMARSVQFSPSGVGRAVCLPDIENIEAACVNNG